MKYQAYLCCVLCTAFLCVVNSEYGRFVSTVTWNTKQGILSGAQYDVASENVYKFKRIPYAKPPLNELRFRRSVLADPWKGTLNATEYGPSCIQDMTFNIKRLLPNLETSEDCLQLNIFVPRNLTKGERLSTMIWVHGGGFTMGQGTMFDGSMLALRGGVIVVTINYRLNVFGFFSSDDPSARGNQGIWDQQLAFKWVKENIADYGGDRNSITIFGESAGSFSVTLHSIIPSNYGLFQRVIAESGSSISDVAFATAESKAVSFQISKELNCITSENSLDLTCLGMKSTQDIVLALQTVFRTSNVPTAFVPIGEDDLIPENIIAQMKDPSTDVFKMFHSVDILAGINSGEAGLMYPTLSFSGLNVSDGIQHDIFCNYVVAPFVQSTFGNCSKISETFCNRYTPTNNKSLDAMTQMAANFYTDTGFLSSTIYMLDYHSKVSGRSSYQYYFTHTPAWEWSPMRPKWLIGPNHASELAFVFGMDFYPSNVSISSEERDLSNRMIRYWTNFANFGNPNGPSGPEIWKQYTHQDGYYMKLDLMDSIGQNLRKQEIDFINYGIPNMVEECLANYSIVLTSSGRVKGKKELISNNTVYTFKGIPFAKPPTGSMRFYKSVQPDPWGLDLNAEDYGPSCFQFVNPNDPRLSNKNKSEDCLQLNIFVPNKVESKFLRPVMIWIHGGGFTSGQGTTIDGSKLAISGDVIIVTINYRLNVFGFFSLNRKPFAGNYGLYDQQMAIKWIKKNIRQFGGDPEKITLFGESAGGVATTLQAIIPSNKGLFQRVIGESGSALSRRDFQTKTFVTSKKILEILKCQLSSDDEIMTCLRSKTSDEIYTAYNEAGRSVSVNYSLTTDIGPIVDGELVVADPLASLEDRTSAPYAMFNSVDILTGTNTADSGLLYFSLMGREKEFGFNISEGVPTHVVCDHIAPAVALDIYDNCTGISMKICVKYAPTVPTAPLQAQSNLAADLYGDLLYAAPTVRSLELRSASSKRSTFQYLFAHRPRWELISDRPQWLIGANHASEIVFVFGLLRQWYPPSIPVQNDELNLSKRMVSYWTNFAKTGNPNDQTGNAWPQFDSENRKYLVLDLQDHVNASLYDDRMAFWNRDIPDAYAKCKRSGLTGASNAASVHKYISALLVLFVLGLCLAGYDVTA